MTDYALEKTITTLNNRVNELGVSEAIVQRQGEKNISVDLPGIQDTTRAKEILGKTATLRFHLVDDESDLDAAKQMELHSALRCTTTGTPYTSKKSSRS